MSTLLSVKTLVLSAAIAASCVSSKAVAESLDDCPYTLAIQLAEDTSNPPAALLFLLGLTDHLPPTAFSISSGGHLVLSSESWLDNSSCDGVEPCPGVPTCKKYATDETGCTPALEKTYMAPSPSRDCPNLPQECVSGENFGLFECVCRHSHFWPWMDHCWSEFSPAYCGCEDWECRVREIAKLTTCQGTALSSYCSCLANACAQH